MAVFRNKYVEALKACPEITIRYDYSLKLNICTYQICVNRKTKHGYFKLAKIYESKLLDDIVHKLQIIREKHRIDLIIIRCIGSIQYDIYEKIAYKLSQIANLYDPFDKIIIRREQIDQERTSQ